MLNSTANAINDGISHFLSALSVTEGLVHLQGCDIQQEYTGASPASGSVYLRALAAYGAGATIQFDATAKERNRLCFHKGNATFMQALFAERGGAIQCSPSNTNAEYVAIHCEGETDDFIYLSNSKFYSIGGSTYLAQFVVDANKAVAGRRYRLLNNSFCSTLNRGSEFFPGNTAGSIEESSYCVYR